VAVVGERVSFEVLRGGGGNGERVGFTLVGVWLEEDQGAEEE
jgi:hypothetical protein